MSGQVPTPAPSETKSEPAAPSIAATPTPEATTVAATPAAEPAKPAEPAKSAAPTAIDVKAFTLPEGFTLDEARMGDFATVASELKLDQAGAQRLVDLHVAALKEASETSSKYWGDLQKAWMDQNHAKFGANPAKHADIIGVAKAIDSLGEERAAALREALDTSGMGNHPAIIEAFAEWAKALNEPNRHPSGSPAGRPASAAEALYGKG